MQNIWRVNALPSGAKWIWTWDLCFSSQLTWGKKLALKKFPNVHLTEIDFLLEALILFLRFLFKLSILRSLSKHMLWIEKAQPVTGSYKLQDKRQIFILSCSSPFAVLLRPPHHFHRRSGSWCRGSCLLIICKFLHLRKSFSFIFSSMSPLQAFSFVS